MPFLWSFYQSSILPSIWLVKRNHRYLVHNKGPYFVTIEPVNHVSKHPILIGQTLHSSFPGIIKNISKSNFSRVDVECYDVKGANKILESYKTLINRNLKAFIHTNRVSREGIIWDIAPKIEIDDIVGHASTNLKCPVLSARLILLRESWLRPDFKISLRNFNLLRTDRPDHQGEGLLMAIRNGIPFKPLHSIYCLNDILDTQAVTIPTDLGQLSIVNV